MLQAADIDGVEIVPRQSDEIQKLLVKILKAKIHSSFKAYYLITVVCALDRFDGCRQN